jgi:ADP-ribose pyrophosphatase
MTSDVVGFEVVSDERVGQGGFLVLRRLRLRVVRTDGSKSGEGLYDFVERPFGLDAVVLALWHRAKDGRARVLLRDGLRVPLVFGRPQSPGELNRLGELVAGILEVGEDDFAALQKRAAAEALEEAGVEVVPSEVERLGPPLYPTPGMCAEKFHLCACHVAHPERACRPAGDGSPFEEGARLRWVDLDEALAACRRGEIEDMKTELGLRRLYERLTSEPDSSLGSAPGSSPDSTPGSTTNR